MAVGRRGRRIMWDELEECKLLSDEELMKDGRVDAVRCIRVCGGRDGGEERLGVGGDSICADICPFQANSEKPGEDMRGGGGGIVLEGRRKKRHHFHDFAVLEDELRAFIFENGVPGVMPTATEFKNEMRGDLLRACTLHGGQKAVADKLGLVRVSLGRGKVKERCIGLERHQNFQKKRATRERIDFDVGKIALS